MRIQGRVYGRELRFRVEVEVDRKEREGEEEKFKTNNAEKMKGLFFDVEVKPKPLEWKRKFGFLMPTVHLARS